MNNKQAQSQPPVPGLQRPDSGDDGASKNRGDNNRTPRLEQQPGRPPQRHQGGPAGGALRPGAFDEDDDAGDTRPNTDTEFAPRS